MQRGDAVGVVAERREDLVGVCAELGRRRWHDPLAVAEAHRWTGLHAAGRSVRRRAAPMTRCGSPVGRARLRRASRCGAGMSLSTICCIASDVVSEPTASSKIAASASPLSSAIAHRGESGIVEQFGLERATQVRPRPIPAGDECDGAVSGRADRVHVREVGRLDDAVTRQRAIHHPVRPEEPQPDVEHRQLDVLAAVAASRANSAAVIAWLTVIAVVLSTTN